MRSSRRFSLYRRMANSSPGTPRLTISETLASSSSRSSVWEVTVDTSSRKSSSSDRSRKRTALRVVSMLGSRSAWLWGRTPVLRPTSTSACSWTDMADSYGQIAGPGGPAQTWRAAPRLLSPLALVSFPRRLYNLHAGAGAHAIGARGHHGAEIVQRANSARGLHPHARPHGVPHQHDVLHGSARRSETGGSLHEIGAGRLRQAASRGLLRVIQQRRLQDHLDDRARIVAHARHRLDIQLHRVEITRPQSPHVDHHVDLTRPRAQRRRGLGYLGFRGSRAQRKPHHRANLRRRTRQFAGGQWHPVWIDAHRGEAVLPRLAAQLDDVRACRLRP